jgi:hypothetical protein
MSYGVNQIVLPVIGYYRALSLVCGLLAFPARWRYTTNRVKGGGLRELLVDGVAVTVVDRGNFRTSEHEILMGHSLFY